MIRLDELILCDLCGAVIIYNSRAQHLEWHARLNARTHSMADHEHISWAEAKQIATEALLRQEERRNALPEREQP